MRFMFVGICLVLTVAGCGKSEMSLTEYVDGLNAIGARARSQSDALAVQYWSAVEPSTNDLTAYLEGAIVVGTETLEASRALRPPAQIADLHDLLFGRHTERMMLATEAFADLSANSFGLHQVLQSKEADAFYAALAEGSATCNEFQTELDATEARGVFAETPWLPGEMKEIVEAFLSCDVYPENLEEMFITPPPTDSS